jgi:hypothetical protein
MVGGGLLGCRPFRTQAQVCLLAARHEVPKRRQASFPEYNKRLKSEYQCAECSKWKPRKDVQIDHVEECGSLKCYEDIAPFLKRLTPEDISAFQILCKKCHQIRTNQQRQKRKENK